MSRSEPVTSRRQRVMVAVVLALGAVMVLGLRDRPAPDSPAAPVAAAHAVLSAVSRGGLYSLVQLPQDGLGAVYQLVAAARRSIDLEIYELADPVMANALVAAHVRGVDVRVLLSQAYHSKAVNQRAFGYLHDHGVAVRWAPVGTIFHIKAMVVDGERALISSGNLTPADYASTSDAARDRPQSAPGRGRGRTLAADWTHPHSVAAARAAPGLLWSPQAAAGLIADIAVGAGVGVLHLRRACRRRRLQRTRHRRAPRRDLLRRHDRVSVMGPGVPCTGRRRMSRACRGGPTGSALLPHQAGHRRCRAAGRSRSCWARRTLPSTSLNANRELSLLLDHREAPTLIAAAAATFRADYARTSAWSA